jgi:hypothetical protein
VAPRKPKGKPKLTRAEAARRNGARGGRPREPGGRGPGGIAWTKVRYYARLGGDRDLIVGALGISAEQLRDQFIANRFNEELARGAAQHQLDLLEDMAGLRRGKKGSVNATLAGLRHASGWDRKDAGKRDARPPDADSAVAELDRVLRRFRAPG